MARMNWDHAARAAQVRARGGDRVEPDTHGGTLDADFLRGKKTKKRKNLPDCSISHSWSTAPDGPSKFVRFCLVCGVTQHKIVGGRWRNGL